MESNHIPSPTAQPGDLAQFIDPRGKKHLVRLAENSVLQTNHGQIFHADVIGMPWGSRVLSHLSKPFYMLEPGLHDVLLSIRRATTIMYPKDIGFILVQMNIHQGSRVIEAGSGSGAFTTALCWAVGSEGHVFSYEIRANVQKLAQKNLAKVGFQKRATFKLKDIGEGFDETGVDAVFLDVPNPEDYIQEVWKALRSGGYFGSLLPTANQVIALLEALKAHDFTSIEACEVILRYYKPIPARLRPEDRLVAHTGYLVFARSITSKV